MKHRQLSFTLLIVILLAGCSGVGLPDFRDPAPVPVTETALPSPEPSATQTLPPTHTPTATVTPSPTVFRTPTETPVNFALAESGFDIADVRYSYPRDDMLVVDFKYRVDERLEEYGSMIMADIPNRCRDNTYGGYFQIDPDVQTQTSGLYFMTRQLTGEGQVVFKMTIEGMCLADGLEFSIWPLDYPTWPYPEDLNYTEFVVQPFEISRNFPTVNSDVIAIRNFHFEPGDDWSGVFSFEYSIADEIPIPLEEYHFDIADDGSDACYFSATGPRITSNSGIYEMEIDLVHPGLPDEANCWQGRTSMTYSNTRLMLEDELAAVHVFDRMISFSYTFWAEW